MTAGDLVLVVDDDRSVRSGISRLLRTAGYAVETFVGAPPLLARLAELDRPCCVLSDVRMPGMDGLALQEELGVRRAPVAVLFMTGYSDVPTAVRAMKGGALDLLQKPVSSGVLLPAVAAAIARARREAETRSRLDDLGARYRTLTRRERQVFALVTAGLLNKQVAFELGTSEKTVKVQRAHVIDKMGARSLADLVRMADRLGVGPWSVDEARAGAEPGQAAAR